MEIKSGLNNTQRKMLDEVYMEQFDKIQKNILGERDVEYKKLAMKVLKDESASEPCKTLLKKINDSVAAQKKTKDYLKERGLKLSHTPWSDSDVTLEASSYDVRHPKLEAYARETNRITIDLAQKRKEIRARIYGVDMSYEAISNEIENYIQSIVKKK